MSYKRPVAAICGMGKTDLSRKPSKHSVRELAVQACLRAVEDAGLKKDDIDGLMLNRSPLEPSETLPMHVQRDAGFKDLSLLTSVEAEGSSAIQMIQYASLAIQAGMAKNVLCVFADCPVGATQGGGATFAMSMELTGIPGWEAQHGFYGATGAYALAAARHMHLYGTTHDHLYAYARSSREWAQLSSDAFLRKELTRDDYFSARWIAEPFRMFDCAFPVNGAIAVVVTAADAAKDMKQPPVYVHGLGQGHAAVPNFAGFEPEVNSGAEIAAKTAFKTAGVSVPDLGFCEVYDAFSFSGMLAMEDIGLCKKGEVGPFVAEGHTAPGGSIPVNTGGGHLSGFYMQGMTPVHEAITQVRGFGGDRQVAKNDIGLVTGSGGRMEFHAAMIVSPHAKLN
ncbi:MAG: thiolase family protein [Kordiimonadaceae bacterium]|nr:thiolase family protein [Kordiimonadaceae bacterium]